MIVHTKRTLFSASAATLIEATAGYMVALGFVFIISRVESYNLTQFRLQGHWLLVQLYEKVDRHRGATIRSHSLDSVLPLASKRHDSGV